MRIPIDKQLHLYAGFVITLLVGWFLSVLNVPKMWIVSISFAMGVLAGALKELVWDKMLNRGHPELADFVFTCFGSLAMLIIFILVL